MLVWTAAVPQTFWITLVTLSVALSWAQQVCDCDCVCDCSVVIGSRGERAGEDWRGHVVFVAALETGWRTKQGCEAKARLADKEQRMAVQRLMGEPACGWGDWLTGDWHHL